MGSVRRRYSLAFATLVVLIATPLLVAATSSKTQKLTDVTCGQVLTTSVSLAADLTCHTLNANALTVGAKGITINLNGHTIDCGEASQYGVYDNGFADVTVENGTLLSCYHGVGFLGGATGSRAAGLHISHFATDGVDVTNSDKVTVTGNVVFDSGSTGIIVTGGSGDQVTANSVEGLGLGIKLFSATAAVVLQNAALNNSTGIQVVKTSGVVSKNVADNNSADGIDVGPGVSVTVMGNRASFNGALGIGSAAGQKDGGGNVVQDNTTAGQCAYVACDEVSN